mmetsp:Transcript_1696/g.3976  ORF Transcript_1696/g.3976 Transcript_1696/m.3976 type:complete len:258 (-) Transcript_1696:78-851(-)
MSVACCVSREEKVPGQVKPGIQDRLRSSWYDAIFDVSNPVSTQNAYVELLKLLRPGSHILDVGVGNGLVFLNPAVQTLIREKDLRIHGVDVDIGAVAIAVERVKEQGLADVVTIEAKDLRTLTKEGDYDYAFFIESYPVIPEELFAELLRYAVEKLRVPEVLLYHNLVPEDEASYFWWDTLRWGKPLMGYMCMNDFGRLTTVARMKEVVRQWGFSDDRVTMEPLLSCQMADMFAPLVIVPLMSKTPVHQYVVHLLAS